MMEELVKLLDAFNRDLRPYAEDTKHIIWDDHIDLARYLIDNDVKQVVHGRWEQQLGIDHCSICHKVRPYDVQADTVEYWQCDYCPNCGAKMDLKENN